MASDTPPDDERDSDVDPWADIVAEGLSDDGDGAAFDFANLDVGPSEPASSDFFSEPTAADDAEADMVGAVDDEQGPPDAASDGFTPTLSVFSPDDAAGWASSSPADSDAFAAEVLDDMTTAERPTSEAADADVAPVAAGHEDTDEFGWAQQAGSDFDEAAANDDASPWGEDVAAPAGDEAEAGSPVFSTDDSDTTAGAAVGAAVGGAAGVTSATSARRAARRPARGKGGIGQFIGIVVGGALSIPIVIGILIGTMWLGRPDPIGMRRWLPGASFLLPPVRQVTRGGGEGAEARGLDALPAAGVEGTLPVAVPADTAPADAVAPVSALAVAPPAVAPGEPPVPAEPKALTDGDDPAAGTPPAEPPAALPVPAVPGLDALAALPLVPGPQAAVAPPPPEPEPLDLGALDAALEQAAGAEAVLEGAAADDPDRRRHMVAWYRSLSRVAEELAMLEALAVESGRPFDEAAVRLDPLMGGLGPDGPRTDDLERLARNWLTYSRRDSDGVVLPVTFQSARPIGPYWCSRVVIEEAGGETSELAVVSRQRPFLELGERCVVTGVIFDGGTIWAADVRSMAGQPADAAASPPIAVPAFDVPEIPVPDLGVPELPKPPPPAADEAPAATDAANAPDPAAANTDATVPDDF